MDAALVGQEWVAPFADAVDEHSDHIEARHYQRRESQHERIDMQAVFFRQICQQLHAEKAQQHAYGEAAGIAHEYLAAALGIAEHVIIEKRYEHADCRKRTAWSRNIRP